MVSTDTKECWVLAPDDRMTVFDEVHYFVNENEGWHCLLCNAGPMHRKQVYHHSIAFKHSKRCKELAQERSILKSRIKMLGYDLWRQQAVDVMSPVSIHSSVEDRRAHYFRFVRTLESYEQMERLSLLELVIWKANCTSYGVVFSTVKEINDYWALESGFDPLLYLQHKRITSGVTVIIENILPFL
jgi:hypothetical protein